MKTFLYLTLKNIKTLSTACLFANIIMLLYSIVFVVIKILSEQSEITPYLIYEVLSHVITNIFSIDFIKEFSTEHKDIFIYLIKFIPSAAAIMAFIELADHLE